MQRKFCLKNSIANFLSVSFFASLFLLTACSGVNVIVGDKIDLKETLENTHTTLVSFYSDNPQKNPDTAVVQERYEVGETILADSLFLDKLNKPGYNAKNWIYFDPENESAEIPNNIQIEETESGVKIKSVHITYHELYFYADGFEARTDTPYTVRHYKQKLGLSDYETFDVANYELFETENLQGTTDAAIDVSAVEKTYIGFIRGEYSDTTYITSDGGAVFNIYYNRKKVNVTINSEAGTFTDDSSKTSEVISGYYETQVPLPLPNLSKEDYKIAGYKNDATGEVVTSITFPAEDASYTVVWTKVESSGGITIKFPEFTAETLTITGAPQTVTTGTAVTITIGGSHTSFKWFINGSETGGDRTLTWTPSESGVYQILCVVDGKYSASVTITVTGTVGS